jgi:hypothetical protein
LHAFGFSCLSIGVRRHILDLEGYDFVLKMDTDALVIAPFGDRIKAFLAANPRAGMVDSFSARA